MSMHGYDFFITEVDVEEVKSCRICTSICVITKNVYGPTSFPMAVRNQSKIHNEYRCPNEKEDWHLQALKLFIEIERMPSKRVASLMIEDLNEILIENGIKPPIGY